MIARIAVLASGGGSNLQALVDYLTSRGGERTADVVLVASDRPGARALERAERAGLQAAVLRSARSPDGCDPLELFRQQRVDFVALAGFLRLVPKEILSEYPSRVLNVHPALLPSFAGPGMYGERVHRAVLESGARVSGATVHLVDDEYDRGRILAQWPVPVLATDTPETLAARVLRVEHRLLPLTIEALLGARDVRASADPLAFVLRPAAAPGVDDVAILIPPARGLGS